MLSHAVSDPGGCAGDFSHQPGYQVVVPVTVRAGRDVAACVARLVA